MMETLAFRGDVVLLKSGDETNKPNLDGKFILVDIDGFTTNRDERKHFVDYDFVLFYEEESGLDDVLLENPVDAVERMGRTKVYYYPKNAKCEAFMQSLQGVELHRFSSPESLIVSYYYFKMLQLHEYWLFMQMVCAFPNIDMYEIHKVTNRNLPEYLSTDHAKKLYSCAQRRDQVRSVPQAIDCIDRFPLDISQKFEKYQSVGIIGLTDFSRRIAQCLSDRMMVDIYDEDMTVEQLREVSPDATNNLGSLVRTCNALVVAKDYDLPEEKFAGKMVFDVCGAYGDKQSPSVKTIGKRGWIVWQ